MIIFGTALIIFFCSLLFGSAILYCAIKLFRHEIFFKTVFVINLILSVTGALLSPFGLLGSLVNFLLMGHLLKKWSTIDSWADIILIALTTTILTWIIILLLLFGLFLPLCAA